MRPTKDSTGIHVVTCDHTIQNTLKIYEKLQRDYQYYIKVVELVQDCIELWAP